MQDYRDVLREEITNIIPGFKTDPALPGLVDALSYPPVFYHQLGAEESLAVCYGCPKTASLAYDRLWDSMAGPSHERFHHSVLYSSFGRAAILQLTVVYLCEWLMGLTPSYYLGTGRPTLANHGWDTGAAWPDASGQVAKLAADLHERLTGVRPRAFLDVPLWQWHEALTRSLARLLTEDLGRRVVPIFSRYPFDSHFHRLPLESPNAHAVVLSVIDNLQLAHESSLQWEQVVEFRKDKVERSNYRRLLHWLDGDIWNKGELYIKDEIACRLHEYARAMKKHGIRTVRGCLEWALSGTTLAKAMGVGSAATALSGSAALGFLAGTGIVVGETVVKLLAAHLDLADVEDQYRDIAYLYDVSERLGK